MRLDYNSSGTSYPNEPDSPEEYEPSKAEVNAKARAKRMLNRFRNSLK